MHFDNIHIAALSGALPDNIQYIDKNPEHAQASYISQFVRQTGVLQRYISLTEQTATDLAYIAIKSALKKASWDKESIDALIFLSQILQYIDITAISGTTQENQFKVLLQTLHHLFDSSKNKFVFLNIIKGISTWSKSKSKSKLIKLVSAELEEIANDFASLNVADDTKLEKFLSILEFYDFSQNEKLRNFLKETSDITSNKAKEVRCGSISLK